MNEIARLRAEYAALHNKVLILDEVRDRRLLNRLQFREQEIVESLKALGASVCPAKARAH